MPVLTNRTWRLPFVAAGIAMMIGGPLHPESDAEQSLRDELATMTAGGTWVLSHALVALGTACLAVGLWAAYRDRSWPAPTRRALRVCAVAMSAYVIETVFHLASVVDSDSLADGGFAPVAFTHVGLSVLLYPVTGLAVAWLGARQLGAAHAAGKVFAVAGIAGGALHAASVPLSLCFPDAELSPVFAGAGMLLAVWAIGTGLAGMPRAAAAGRRAATGADPYREVLARA